MEAVAEGLWALADGWEKEGRFPEALKCLEAICQSQVSFLPVIEVKTRLRIGYLLLQHSENMTQAKYHLERAQLLLKQVPACFELKCRTYSLLGRCYHLLGSISKQEQTLRKGLELVLSAGNGESGLLWACNFNLELASALTMDGNFENGQKALESALNYSAQMCRPELELVFATSLLHLYLIQWHDSTVVERSVQHCDSLWNRLSLEQKQSSKGLFVYKELLHTFYLLRACDYKEASAHVTGLDAALDEDVSGNLLIGPAALDGEWLPKGAVLVMVDLMGAICLRPKGLFKECFTRLQSGTSRVQGANRNLPGLRQDYGSQCCRVMFMICLSASLATSRTPSEELSRLGVTSSVLEGDLQHWAIWMAGVYLVLLLQLIENKTIIDLTQSDFVATQQGLLQMLDWFERFPVMLKGCESNIQMLLGHYAHSMGFYQEAALHFIEAVKLTDIKGTQAMCCVNAALSYICLGDLSQAVDMITPVYRSVDSFVGVREKTSALFTSGLLQMRQNNFQEARARLASGLKLTHKQLGNHQLVSQYLTLLGSLAVALQDRAQAQDILKSSFTLAKALHDLPTQVGVLQELTALLSELGESAKELENSKYQSKKAAELRQCMDAAISSGHHPRLLQVLSYIKLIILR